MIEIFFMRDLKEILKSVQRDVIDYITDLANLSLLPVSMTIIVRCYRMHS